MTVTLLVGVPLYIALARSAVTSKLRLIEISIDTEASPPPSGVDPQAWSRAKDATRTAMSNTLYPRDLTPEEDLDSSLSRLLASRPPATPPSVWLKLIWQVCDERALAYQPLLRQTYETSCRSALGRPPWQPHSNP